MSQVRVLGHTCDGFQPSVHSGVAGQAKNGDLRRSVVVAAAKKGRIMGVRKKETFKYKMGF